MNFKVVINIISVQLAWLACAYGATNGQPWIGIAACMAVIIINLIISDDARTLLITSVLLGFYGAITESVWAYHTIISYSSPGPFDQFAPLWIVALWTAFGGMIHPAFGFLIRRPLAAALLGATMAPWSYYAASQLGALQLSEPLSSSVLLIAMQWGVALPAAIYLRERFTRQKAWLGAN